MAINSQLLKNSLNKCQDGLKKYFELILFQSLLVKNLLISKDKEKYYGEIKENEKKANNIYHDEYDSMAWYISQNQPVSINLKFFLTFISSIKELEMTADCYFKISKTFVKYVAKYDYDTKKIVDFFDVMLATTKKIWNIFIKKPLKISSIDFNEIVMIKNNFDEIYNNIWISVSKDKMEYLNHISNSKKQKLVFHINFMLVKIERSLNSVFNIIENFYLIHNLHFENKELINE